MNNKKATIFADLGTLALAAALACACGCRMWDAALEDAAAEARRLSGADAIDARIGGIEERQTLLFGYVGALAEASGIGETAARDWLNGKSAEKAEEADEAEEPAALDEGDFSAFRWQFGGVDGSRAKLDKPRISKLKMGRDGLSFRWEVGLQAWGLADGEAGALACLFVTTEKGEIVGGKFDWISTSRSGRSLENALTGYNGWSLAGVGDKCTVFFVVVSASGKQRSNVITATWER